MLDDSEIASLSVWLMVISAEALALALILYAKDPRCLWRTRHTIEWTGKGFDPAAVTERVSQVRRDYVSALHSRPHPRFHSRELLSATGRMIRACSYWRRASATETTEERQEPASKGPAA